MSEYLLMLFEMTLNNILKQKKGGNEANSISLITVCKPPQSTVRSAILRLWYIEYLHFYIFLNMLDEFMPINL